MPFPSPEDKCPVCYEFHTPLAREVLTCLHVICAKCKGRLVKEVCPICRHPVGLRVLSVELPRSVPETFMEYASAIGTGKTNSAHARTPRRRRIARRSCPTDDTELMFVMEDIDPGYATDEG